jgi:hypothetical protein
MTMGAMTTIMYMVDFWIIYTTGYHVFSGMMGRRAERFEEIGK